MANTKKTITQKTNEDILFIPKEMVIDTEKEELKAQLAEQQSQFEQLKAQMEVMMKAVSASTSEKASSPIKKDRNITFINLTAGTLILKGSTFWKIEGQFVKRTFLEREARLIVSNMPNLVSSGAVYIADAQFVEENDLGEAYQNLLTDLELKNLLEHDASFVIEAYKNASEGQKDIIINLVVNKKLNGEEVDANVLTKLGKLCNRNLMEIEPLNETEG